MSFAAIFVPDFPVEAIVRAEPALREEAVAVLEGKPPLERVAAASERARAFGIEPGMTRLQVEEFGAAVRLRRRSPAQEEAARAALRDSACAFSPVVEATAADAVLLDLAGLESLFGAPAKIARDLARRASELGLETNVAVAANADAALYAARGFPGVTVIPAEKTAERLGALPIDVLAPAAERPEGPDGAQPVERFVEVMERWGIRTFRQLATLPSVAVVERLGQRGLELQRLARGEVERKLVPLEPPLVFEESVELEYPVDNLEPLAFLLNRMLEQLCARLAARALATSELRVTCGLDPAAHPDDPPRRHGGTEDFGQNSKFKPQNSSASPCLRGEQVFSRTLKLPVAVQDAKVLLKLLQLDLKAHPPPAPVAKLALRAEPVRPRAVQDGFFVPLAPEPEKLELLLARAAALVGEENVGAAEVLDSHRPDAFRMKKFRVPSTAPRASGLGPRASRLALRLYRPPLRAKVEMKAGQPARISFLEAARAEVAACAGPWRTSGEWWTDDGWQRDEWDVAVRTPDGAALYRIYRDAASEEWFVFGCYD